MLAFRGNFEEGGLAPLTGESVCGFSFASFPDVAHCFDSSSLMSRSSIVDPGEGGGAGWGVAMTAPLDQFKGENGYPVWLGTKGVLRGRHGSLNVLRNVTIA